MVKSILRKLLLFVPLAISLVFLFPHISKADAINPLINLFTPGTILPASILTVFIIFVETGILRFWLKQIPFRVHLWRAAAMNIVSSAAGSIIALLFYQDQMMWRISTLYIPMFFLTLATETPTLKLLYKRDGISWERSIAISGLINIISYILLFIAQFGLILAYLGYAGFADKQTIKNWNDISLLKGESGYIYTIKYLPSDGKARYAFNKYNVSTNTWEVLDPGFEKGVYPSVWDIKGNVIVCVVQSADWKNRSLTVLDANTFSPIVNIKGNFRNARLSPDLKKVAALEYVKEVKTTKDSESDYMLGTACKLNIYDAESGVLLQEVPRLALDEGFAWTIDSSGIIFTSLRDESLYKPREVDDHRAYSGRSYAKRGQFPVDLFHYKQKTNSIRRLPEGQIPHTVPGTNEITFFRESGFYSRELWRMDIDIGKPQLVLSDIRGYEHAVSSSGKKYLVLYPHKQPLGSNRFLTLVDPLRPDSKFIVEPYSHYGFRWVQK